MLTLKHYLILDWNLEDYGKDNSSLNSGQKADHGLLLMFQSLGSNITQPIAVLASKGSVKGD